MELTKKQLGIKELNLSNALFFGNIRRLMNSKIFDFDVYLPSKGLNLQRDLVWDIFQKRSLIHSLFKEYFGSQNGIKLIPPISAVIHQNEDRSEVFQIIDGKQRLSTIFSFINNEFTICDNDGMEYYFDALDKELPKGGQ